MQALMNTTGRPLGRPVTILSSFILSSADFPIYQTTFHHPLSDERPPTSDRLSLKVVRYKEPDVRRALRQAAHEVRIPVCPVGHIDANLVSVFYQLFL
jgi:hypothetical protein